MKQFIFFLLISNFSSLIFVPLVEAHVLQSDGSIGAVLHTSPDDDPVAGVPTDFFFEFKDKKGTFTPTQCNCMVTILENGNEIYSQSLFQNSISPSLEDASFTYTLPQKGIYSIRATGVPKSAGAFEQFSLTWDVRVDKDAQTASEPVGKNWITDTLVYFLGFALFIAVLVFAKKKGGGK